MPDTEQEISFASGTFEFNVDGGNTDEVWIGLVASGVGEAFNLLDNNNNIRHIITSDTVNNIVPGYPALPWANITTFGGQQPNNHIPSDTSDSSARVIINDIDGNFNKLYVVVGENSLKRQLYEFPNGLSAATTIIGNNLSQGTPGTIATLSGFDLDGDIVSWEVINSANGSTTFSSANPGADTGTTDIIYTPDINFTGSATVVVSLSANSQITYATINFDVTADSSAFVRGSTITGGNTIVTADDTSIFDISIIDSYGAISSASSITTSSSTLGATISISNFNGSFASLTYIAYQAGTEDILVYADGVLIATLTFTITHGSLASVALSADKTMLVASRPTTATITAELRDSNNNLITSPSSIVFNTNDSGTTLTLSNTSVINTTTGTTSITATSKINIEGQVIITSYATLTNRGSASSSVTIRAVIFSFNTVDDLFFIAGSSAITTLTINNASTNTNITITSGAGTLLITTGATTIYTVAIAGTALITAVDTIDGSNISNSIIITATSLPSFTLTTNDDIINASEISSLTLTGSAEAGSSVNIIFSDTNNNSFSTTTITNNLGTWTINNIDLSNLADGTITINATTTYISVNVNATTSTIITKDTIIAILTISAITGDNIINANEINALTLTGSAEAGSSVTVIFSDINNNSSLTTTITNNLGTWTINNIDLSNLADGNITIYASATDIALNISATTNTIITKDTISLTPTISTIAGDNIINANEITTLTATGSAEASSSVNIIFSDASNTSVATTVIADNTGTWTINAISLSSLVDGNITVYATATDVANNISAATSVMLIKIAVIPNAPTATAQISSTINIVWATTTAINYYRLYSAIQSNIYTEIASRTTASFTIGSAVSYKDTNLSPSTTYQYQLRACINSDISTCSVSSTTSIATTKATFSLDVDNNGTTNAKDGLIILRFLAGSSNENLITGLVDGNSISTAQIRAYLITHIARLDVDGNGIADSATDGFLIIRYLNNPNDTNLTNEIIGNNNLSRTTADSIRTYLNQFYQ